MGKGAWYRCTSYAGAEEVMLARKTVAEQKIALTLF
jgi:hypothetical protein